MKYLVFILMLFSLVSCGAAKNTSKGTRNDSAVRITHSAPKSSQNPCFSPDGQSLIFTRFLNGYNVGPSEIVKIKTDGSEETIIVPAGESDNVNVPYGSWVGHTICFASDRGGASDEIWIADDDGKHLRQITTHPEGGGIYYIEPVFNPQNTHQIVFEYVTGEEDKTARHQIAFLDVDTGQVTVLTDGTYDDRLPSWSHDGKQILFQRKQYDQDEGWRVYTADITTSPTAAIHALKLIYFGKGDYTDCSWNFDDTYVLSSSPFDGIAVPNIWQFPLDASRSPIRSTHTRDIEDGAPAQSPDGRQIAFESHYGDSEEVPSEIWIIQ